jgi:hypothetical protein
MFHLSFETAEEAERRYAGAGGDSLFERHGQVLGRNLFCHLQNSRHDSTTGVGSIHAGESFLTELTRVETTYASISSAG